MRSSTSSLESKGTTESDGMAVGTDNKVVGGGTSTEVMGGGSAEVLGGASSVLVSPRDECFGDVSGALKSWVISISAAACSVSGTYFEHGSTPAGLAALHHFGGLPPSIAKAVFLSSWLAFAAALFLLNRQVTQSYQQYPRCCCARRSLTAVTTCCSAAGGSRP